MGAVDLSRYLWPDIAEKRQPDGLILTRPGLILVNPATGVVNGILRPVYEYLSAARIPTPGGVGLKPFSAANYIRFKAPTFTGSGAWTIFIHFYNHSALSGSYVYACAALSGTATKVAIAARHSGGSYNVSFYNGAASTYSALPASSVGLHTIVITGDGSTITFYVDGASDSVANTTTATALDGFILNGYTNTGGGYGFANTSTILLSGAELRCWNADEALEFTDNPWSIADPQSRSIFIPSASGGAYTLTAAQGTFTETGNNAGLTAQRNISASQGSFAESGQSTGLNAQRKIAASQGSFAESGQAADLTKTGSYSLTASQGSFAESGQVAGLTAQRKIGAEPGSISLIGQAATLTKTTAGQYVLTAAGGAFAETGQSTNLTAQRLLASSAGSIVLAGGVVTFRHIIPGEVAPIAAEFAIRPPEYRWGLRPTEARWGLRPTEARWAIHQN